MKKTIASAVGALAIALTPEINASDINIGARAPETNYQFDERIGFSERDLNGSKTKAIVSNSILKYWNGDKLGMWAFVNVPYKEVSNDTGRSVGFGDVSLGLGPRGRIDLGEKGNLHWISYAGLNLPTGDTDNKPNLGNGRLDKKVGLFSTYMTLDKKVGVDTSLEYNFTGENNLGKKPSDELYAGAIVNRKIANNWRLGVGSIGTLKQNGKNDGDYLLTARGVLRFDHPSKKWHAVILADKDISSRNMPSGYGVTGLVRYNF